MLRISGFLVFLLLALQVLWAADSSGNSHILKGYVDMHTHPRSDLAFGAELFYGQPYGNMETELQDCSQYHKSWSPKNPFGNVFRAKLSEQTEKQYFADCTDGYTGYPDFKSWPSWCGVLHQQMWVDWIERAHQGGLNIMVALATHNHCLADAAETCGHQDDKQVMLDLITGIKQLVASSNFMEIASQPSDVRRIVGAGKLAVVLGIEMDNIGNFYSPAGPHTVTYIPQPTNQQVQDELDSIWDLGVRYIFPVHLTNNLFGGSAIYIPAFNVANKYNTGKEFVPERVSTRETGISFRLGHPVLTMNPESDMLSKVVLRLSGGILPRDINPSRMKNYTFWDTLPVPDAGDRNALGLTETGRFAIRYMMQKGFMIDIDHMSEKAVTEALQIATQEKYPLNSGHNGLRGDHGNENGRTVRQYEQIIELGGMIGLGHGETAPNFVSQFRQVSAITGNKNIAIGTDVNGFYPLPQPNPEIVVTYDSTFTPCTSGNRAWNINTDGVAHYGLMPDYIRSWQVAGMTPEELDAFMHSAEYFTRMWEICEERAKSNPQ